MNYETIFEVVSALFFLGFILMSARAKELFYEALYLGLAAITLLATIADRLQ